MSASTSAVWESLSRPSTWGSPARTARSARGLHVEFADGERYLCATSGLWNVNLGYGNEAVAGAVHAALREASYLGLFRQSNVYAEQAAARLIERAGADLYGRVIFSTSGAAVNDVTMKLVRQHALLSGDPARRLVVGLRDSYHGLTYGSFALTGEQLGQSTYSVDQRLVRHVSASDIGELRELLRREGGRIAAVVVEPVLGTGAHALSEEFVSGLGVLREEHGFLLVADEVATGFGRTGPFFASSSWAVRPDVLLASKGLTNGTSAAAVALVSHGIAATFEAADATFVHGETQAGTPATCAAIVATLDEFDRLDGIASAARVAVGLERVLDELSTRDDVAGVRGAGCFRALELRTPDGDPLDDAASAAYVAEIRRAGLLVQPAPGAVQLVPALVYSDDDLGELLARLTEGMDAARELGRSPR